MPSSKRISSSVPPHRVRMVSMWAVCLLVGALLASCAAYAPMANARTIETTKPRPGRTPVVTIVFAADTKGYIDPCPT